MREFLSFFKTVSGGEGDRCLYPTRLDTYGCGCSHDCKYCYAKSLLEFRGLWDPKEPRVADIGKIKRKITKIPRGTIIRLGGMTDCLQDCEAEHKVTLQTIKALNEAGIGYLIVTKSHRIATPEYMSALDPGLAHVQISITSTDDSEALTYERASLTSKRIEAAEKLQAAGFDVALRLSPLIPGRIDPAVINAAKVEKLVIEFLRVNHWVKRWMAGVDFSLYTLRGGGYMHLPLETKINLVAQYTDRGKQITVCEDVPEHYDYWRANVNANPLDCCNLRKGDE